MGKKFIAGGCSFTYGHELNDAGEYPSKKTWAYGLMPEGDTYVCKANNGSGNSGIARRVFHEISATDPNEIRGVVVMWSLLSRYDWAMMPQHDLLEDTRWASISPWSTKNFKDHVSERLSTSQEQQQTWKNAMESWQGNAVSDFAEAIYKHAANEYHEAYISWKNIVWLQNLLEKKKIPYMFTLADNSLFYMEQKGHSEPKQHKDSDDLLKCLHSEIDFTKWFYFGDMQMGFNQWAKANKYSYGTTHPLEKAHEDAVELMRPTFTTLFKI